MKRQRTILPNNTNNDNNVFHVLSDEIIFIILDFLEKNPIDKKSFSLVCKSFHAAESKHRKKLKPLRSDHLAKVLHRYPNGSHVDLTLCSRVPDASLVAISNACRSTLRSIDLSRSNCFSGIGLLSLAANCKNLVEIDLSNATELRDSAVAALGEAKNLERLWMGRCKMITDMGVGCIAVGCRKLRLINLKWCLRVSDLGVGLLAVKCKDLRSLDLSYLPITDRCLPSIFELQYLEDLVLEGCFSIDDDGLSAFKHGCKSLKKLDISSCQNISHVGLSALTSGSDGCLEQLVLSYGSPVTLALADSLGKLPTCSNLSSLKVGICLNITDDGIVNIGMRCSKLVELDLYRCTGISDSGISAIARGCPGLEVINIAYCKDITDSSLISLSKCSSLNTVESRGCPLITSLGLAAIAVGCKQLTKLDVKKCSNIDDAGMILLAHFSQNLRQINLCTGISDSGISAIARGCPGLEVINIAYCKDITDSSLISLSKCSSLNTVESRGCPLITSLGLAAIAVGCKQLTKLDVKKCSNIDDAGMILLAHFSQNLRQFDRDTCI
ncbi:hypothetical protein C1H46_037621 [Malus baccata]|uniref:F-box/LRR-repeat protein 15-like leucin rich repeat domain-containing protein n=1 Tax=Malus baccata TaxID=106549 RepID=A0A540KRI2_MALBA|nr:hypothetical protein C1H46_037621 [Malus baccata]